MVTAMVFTACRKDDDGLISLNAEITNYTGDSNTKMYVDASRYTHWTSGDQVNINGTACPVDLSGSKAQITDVATAASYSAIYPASIVTGTNTVNLPAEQAYSVDGSGNQLIAAPMAAYTTGTTLTFANLCALIRVDVNPTFDITMERIIVTSSSVNLCGSGTIDFSGTPTLGALSGSKTVTLTFDGSTTVSSGNTKSFYIYVPQFSSDITVDVQAIRPSVNEKKYEWKKTSTGASISANQIGIVSGVTPAFIDTYFYGAGTEADPYLIYTKTELKNTSGKANFFKVMKNFSCGGSTWTPVADFTGTLDGNGKTITYIINNTENTTKNLGLFAKATGATIKNLKVNGSISTNCYGGYTSGIGSIVGYNSNSTIQNCYSNVTIESSYTGSSNLVYGGVVGYLNGGSVSYCFASGSINGNGKNRVGGIVAHQYSGTITHCTFEGTISGGTKIGTIAGNANSTANITDCHYYVADKANYAGIRGIGSYSATGEDIAGTVASDKTDLTTYVSGISGYDVYTSSLTSRLSEL